jgi:hypothetical protein
MTDGYSSTELSRGNSRHAADLECLWKELRFYRVGMEPSSDAPTTCRPQRALGTAETCFAFAEDGVLPAGTGPTNRSLVVRDTFVIL